MRGYQVQVPASDPLVEIAVQAATGPVSSNTSGDCCCTSLTPPVLAFRSRFYRFWDLGLPS